MLQFREIQLDDKETFQSYFQQRRYDNAHFNFTNFTRNRHRKFIYKLPIFRHFVVSDFFFAKFQEISYSINVIYR